MKVVRLRRGWKVSLTDNEMELLRATVQRGLNTFETYAVEAMPHKIRKVFMDQRWDLPHGPLTADEDRRPAA